MLGEQTFEGRRESLSQANKLSRTHVLLVEALNPTAAKANRKSRSSTSTSILEARRSSETWAPWGVRIARNQRNNPMQSKLPMHLSRRCGARTKSSGKACQSLSRGIRDGLPGVCHCIPRLRQDELGQQRFK
jgi:hypothetical protein